MRNITIDSRPLKSKLSTHLMVLNSDRSKGGIRGEQGPRPIFNEKEKKITEGRKVSSASKITPHPSLPLAQGRSGSAIA